MTAPNTPPVSPALLRVAEACEDAAEDARIEVNIGGWQRSARKQLIETAEILEAHARVIREGRINVTTA